jgi:hypothetical protein
MIVKSLRAKIAKLKMLRVEMENNLTLEQQFEIAKLRHVIEGASPDQLRGLIIDLYEAMFERENAVKELLANQWGIELVD